MQNGINGGNSNRLGENLNWSLPLVLNFWYWNQPVSINSRATSLSLHDWTRYTFSSKPPTCLGCLYRHSFKSVSITLPYSPGWFEKAADECVHGVLLVQHIGMKRVQNHIPRASSVVPHKLELVKFLLLIFIVVLWLCAFFVMFKFPYSSLVNSVSRAKKKGQNNDIPTLKRHLRLETPSSLSGCWCEMEVAVHRRPHPYM
jgi:hypothetical protein